MATSGELYVGIEWAMATARPTPSPATETKRSKETTRRIATKFLNLLFRDRSCQSAFAQCVDLNKFNGHLAGGTYTALETLARLQRFTDEAKHLKLRNIAVDAEKARAVLECALAETSEPCQLHIQVLVTNGKIIEYDETN